MERLIPVDIMIRVNNEDDIELLDYLDDVLSTESWYTPEYFKSPTRQGGRFCMGLSLSRDLVTMLILRWPDCIDLDVDPELHKPISR